MRLRIRGPGGQSSLELGAEATVADLKLEIYNKTSIPNFDLKYGYPYKVLDLGEYMPTTKLIDLGVKLDGEQLLVSKRESSVSTESSIRPSSLPTVNRRPGNELINQLPRDGHPPPLSLTRAPPAMDVPELPLASHSSTIILRIMPDDNSCLFRAFNSAFFGAMDNMHELRSIIAQHIQSHPSTYSAAVLDQPPDDYCRWIQTSDAWGGAIELGILSAHFDIEICSIDVQTLRVDRFNEGRSSRCILVYSGIHYDVIALSPSDPPFGRATAPPEFDVKVFDAGDDAVLSQAVNLCKVLQDRHYYTDTAAFSVKCNVCGGVFTGENGATEHAKQTGHYDFGEAT